MAWYSLFLFALGLWVAFEIGRHFSVKVEDRLDRTDEKIGENTELLHLLHRKIEPVAAGLLPQATIDQAEAQLLGAAIIGDVTVRLTPASRMVFTKSPSPGPPGE